MKISIISKKKLHNHEVVDVNGDACMIADCFQSSFRNALTDIDETQYIQILKQDQQAPRSTGTYMIDLPEGLAQIPSKKVRFIPRKGGWYRLKQNESFVTCWVKYNGNVIEAEDVFDPFVTVRVFEVDKRGRSKTIYVQDSLLAKELGYVPSKQADHYVSASLEKMHPDQWKKEMRKHSFSLNLRTTHHADGNNPTFNIVKGIYDTMPTPKVDISTKRVAKLLGGKSFGLEYEAVGGAIQTCDLGRLGLVPLTDGSIGHDNYEFTSVPMEGVKGLDTIKKQCNRLTQHCTLNSNCAFHVHIGNVKNDKLTFLALYTLLFRLQDEIYAMFPFYKQHEVAVMGKSKEYSRRLFNLELNTNKIYDQKNKKDLQREVEFWHKRVFEYFACEQEGPNYHRGSRNVPWSRKWHCPTRYAWANFVNYLFSSSGTIEFRIHEPTLNFTKVSTFLLLCTALVRYAEMYPERILRHKEKIMLADVIDELRTNFGKAKVDSKYAQYYNEVADYMQQYITFRCDHFRRQMFNANHNAARSSGDSFRVIRDMTNTFIQEDSSFQFTNRSGMLNLY